MNEELRKHISEVVEQSKNDEGYQQYLADKRVEERLRWQMACGDRKRYIFTIGLPPKVMKDKGLLGVLAERAIEHHYFKNDKLLRIECSLEDDTNYFNSYFACLRMKYRSYWRGGRYYKDGYFSYGFDTKSNNFYFPSHDPESKHFRPQYIAKLWRIKMLKREGRHVEADFVNFGLL